MTTKAAKKNLIRSFHFRKYSLTSWAFLFPIIFDKDSVSEFFNFFNTAQLESNIYAVAFPIPFISVSSVRYGSFGSSCSVKSDCKTMCFISNLLQKL